MNYLQNIEKAIVKSGLKKKFIAKQLNIKYDTFRRKLNGEGDFKLNEILTLSQILNIKLTEVFKNEES
jgi:ribosome-binding protein aMBF1 (putative translation factor)